MFVYCVYRNSSPVFDKKVGQRGNEAVLELPLRDYRPTIPEQHGLVLIEHVMKTLSDGSTPTPDVTELRQCLLAHLLHYERELPL